jgi:tetratricopeptide (TPR) repeat protein/precorrin-6B methylase 2
MLQLRKRLGSEVWRTKAKTASEVCVAVSIAHVDEQDAIAKGSELFDAGRFAEALAVVDEALASKPNDGTLLFARGATLFAWGRFHEAAQTFEQASDAGLDDLDLDVLLGWCCQNLQRAADAEGHFRKAVARSANSEKAYISLANLLESRGMLATHAEEFERGLSRWPQNYDGLLLLAACRFYLNDRGGGIAAFRQAISVDPRRSRGWANLGVTLSEDERFDEALQALKRAFDIDVANGHSESLLNYATVLREDGQLGAAMKLLNDNLARNPDPRAHWLRSILLLEAGQYTEAWREYEFRWMKEPLVSQRRVSLGPIWAGQDLQGKTILIHAEQGLGDAIQFVRYASPLKALGARVVLDSFKDLGDLSQDFEDIDEVAAEGPLPAFDFRIALLSIPRVLGTTLATIPAHVPYVKVRPDYVNKWRPRISATNRLKVGLVWSGNQKHPRNRLRSMKLEQLEGLGSIEGVQLYSLQKSETAVAEIAASKLDIVDLGKDFENFRDTAAAMSLLDLVISVDTSVAHLAGALGRPTWVMVSEPPDWRWLLEGERTPWYPSVRLFRQRERNRWKAVVNRVEDALRQLAASDTREPSPSSIEVPVVQIEGVRSIDRDAGDLERICRVDETRYGIVQYPPTDRAMAESLRYYGEYRQSELALLERFIKPGSWALDANCGCGAVSLFLANAVGPSGHVIAYEDDPLLHQVARQNLEANRVRNVTLLSRSLLSASDIASLREEPGASSGICGAGTVDTVDALRLSRLDWIVINSRSIAKSILEGASQTLWRFRPWLYATIENDEELRKLARVARDHGYQPWHFRAPLFRSNNYNCRSDDIFSGRQAQGVFCLPEEVEMDVVIEGCTLINLEAGTS